MHDKYFYNLFGETLSRPADGYPDRVCKACFLGEVTTIALLSVLGMTIHLIDMWQLLQGKEISTEDIWRNRVQRGQQRVVSEDTERNLKFAFSILYFEHFLFMFIAWLNREPMLLVPWLTMQSVVIILEFLLFVIRVVIEHEIPSKQEAIMMFVILYNYSQVYCFQRSITRIRGGCLH